MEELNFETGIVSYSICGKCDVSFNPTDSIFAKRLYDAMKKIDDIINEYRPKAEKTNDPIESYDLVSKMDDEIGAVLDETFGTKVYESVFDNLSPCAFGNGFPIWLNLILSAADKMDDSIGDVKQQTEARIAKYKTKYQKYTARYHK